MVGYTQFVFHYSQAITTCRFVNAFSWWKILLIGLNTPSPPARLSSIFTWINYTFQSEVGFVYTDKHRIVLLRENNIISNEINSLVFIFSQGQGRLRHFTFSWFIIAPISTLLSNFLPLSFFASIFRKG